MNYFVCESSSSDWKECKLKSYVFSEEESLDYCHQSWQTSSSGRLHPGYCQETWRSRKEINYLHQEGNFVCKKLRSWKKFCLLVEDQRLESSTTFVCISTFLLIAFSRVSITSLFQVVNVLKSRERHQG